jgi:hypothetical protein
MRAILMSTETDAGYRYFKLLSGQILLFRSSRTEANITVTISGTPKLFQDGVNQYNCHFRAERVTINISWYIMHTGNGKGPFLAENM